MIPTTDRVLIFDTTLRDGEQAPGCSMTQPEKLRVARALAELGVDIIEAGFPAASRGDWEAVNAVAREVAEETGAQISWVRYFASQPWPFPASLMIGCHAAAVSSGQPMARSTPSFHG